MLRQAVSIKSVQMENVMLAISQELRFPYKLKRESIKPVAIISAETETKQHNIKSNFMFMFNMFLVKK